MTTIGAVVALALIITGHKPKRHAGCWYFNVGESWGGMELGLFFVTDKHDSTSVKNHEFGHSLQNAIWGPFTPFVICIPSATRYWYRELKYDRKGIPAPTKYDDIWFEGQATKWGTKVAEIWDK